MASVTRTTRVSIDDLLTMEFSFIQELIWSSPHRNPFSRCSNKIITDLKDLRSSKRNSTLVLQADGKRNLSGSLETLEEICNADLNVLIKLRRIWCNLLAPFNEQEKHRLLELEEEIDEILTNQLENAWKLSKTQETGKDATWSFQIFEIDRISLDAAIRDCFTSFYHDISLVGKEGHDNSREDLKKHFEDYIEGQLAAEITVSSNCSDVCENAGQVQVPLTAQQLGRLQMPEGNAPFALDPDEITESFLSSETTISNGEEHQRIVTITENEEGEEGEEYKDTPEHLKVKRSNGDHDLKLIQTNWQVKNYGNSSSTEIESKDESDLSSSPNFDDTSLSPGNDSITSGNVLYETRSENYSDETSHYWVADRKFSVLCDRDCDESSKDVCEEEICANIFELSASKSFETATIDINASGKQDIFYDNLSARKLLKTSLECNAGRELSTIEQIKTTELKTKELEAHKQNSQYTNQYNQCDHKSVAAKNDVYTNSDLFAEMEMIMKARIRVNTETEEADWHVIFALANHSSYRVAVNSLSFWPLDGSWNTSTVKWPKGKMVLEECPAFLCYSTKFPCRGKTDSPEIAFSWNYEKISKQYSTRKSCNTTKEEIPKLQKDALHPSSCPTNKAYEKNVEKGKHVQESSIRKRLGSLFNWHEPHKKMKVSEE